jgi:biopolymer transport protein ExbB
MDGLQDFWSQSDLIGRTVAVLLLGLSIGAWVTILWRGWLLRRTLGDLGRAIQAFWQAPDLAQARLRLLELDREQVLVGMLDAMQATPQTGSLESGATSASQLTRRLRDSLHDSLSRLQAGQVFLASVGATAPFIGLFGTVWGIYHALLGIATLGGISIDKVAGPVGEALIMTAAGLAVAIPAVLAYNLFGKWLGQCEAELEGFALDLRDMAQVPGAER